MTVTSLTVDTAPRNLEELVKAGRYNLRTVATQLNLMADEKSKQAFMSLGQEEQAKTVLAALLERDGGGKKAAANGAAVRQPSNKGAKGGAKAATTETTAAVTTAGGEGASQVIALLKGIKESLDSLTERMGNVEESVGGLELHVAGTNKLVSVALSLNLTLAENILGAPPAQVLQTSIEDVSTIEPALRAFIGEVEDEEGEEEEEEEGNG